MSWLGDVPFFLALARHKRLGAAAASLEVSHSTVSRRVAALEKALGCHLFDKTLQGWQLTHSGRRLYTDAVRIEATAADAFATLAIDARAPAGTVRLLTTEAFGISVVAPAVGLLRRSHPSITLELLASSRRAISGPRMFDLAVTVQEPDLPDVVNARLADYGLGLYASRDYLARCGGPLTFEQLACADFVWCLGSVQEIPELQFLRSLVPDPRIVFHATSVLGQQAAVAAGTGVGLLPHFLAASDDRLVRVLAEEVCLDQEYWLVIPAESARSPATQAVARFLRQVTLQESSRLADGTPTGELVDPRLRHQRLVTVSAEY
jgi:DNA-binding transcriptional LysR family regulator